MIFEKTADFLRVRGSCREERVIVEWKDTRADVPRGDVNLTIAQARAMADVLLTMAVRAESWSPGFYKEPGQRWGCIECNRWGTNEDAVNADYLCDCGSGLVQEQKR